MPLLFTCPHCQTKTLVENEFAGKAGACASCDKPITVPSLQDDGSIGTTPDQQRRGKTVRLIASICVSLVVICSVVFLIFKYGSAGFSTMQANALKTACKDNAKQIAAALKEYEDDYGTFPTPVVKDANGKALYSWRVLILPYLGYQTLYQSFDLNEPWDSEANMNVAMNRPDEFGSPAASGYGWSETNYMLLTGPGTIFPDAGPLALDDVLDSHAQTLLVVEVARPSNTSALRYWTEPMDLDISRMARTIGTKNGTEIGGNHADGATAATCDGLPHFLSKTLTPEEVRALSSPAGGEPLRDDLLDNWD